MINENPETEGSVGKKTLEEFIETDEFISFKKKYKPIFDQIVNREHLGKGYVSYSVDLPAIGEIEVRTLTKRERDFISMNFPVKNFEDVGEINKQEYKRHQFTMLLTIAKFNGEDCFLKWTGKDMKYDEWMEQAAVKDKWEMIQSMGEFVEETIMMLSTDIRLGAKMALLEQLKNLHTPE